MGRFKVLSGVLNYKVEEDYIHVTYISVKDKRKRIGSTLLEMVKVEAEMLDMDIILELEVLGEMDEEGLRDFYIKNGFEEYEEGKFIYKKR